MDDLKMEFLAQAFAEVGIEIKCGSTCRPSFDGCLEAIAELGRQRDAAMRDSRAAGINARRQLALAEWLKECAEKDVEKYKSRLRDAAEAQERKGSK